MFNQLKRGIPLAFSDVLSLTVLFLEQELRVNLPNGLQTEKNNLAGVLTLPYSIKKNCNSFSYTYKMCLITFGEWSDISKATWASCMHMHMAIQRCVETRHLARSTYDCQGKAAAGSQM